MGCFYTWQQKDLLLYLKVQPKASKDEFCEVLGDVIKLRITAPPSDGKANQHLIKFISKVFSVPQKNITLLSGETSREKRIRIIQPQQLPDFIKPAIN